MIVDIKIAIIGLGYVGLPLACEFGKKYHVVGFDLKAERINQLKTGFDHTKQITRTQLKKSKNLLLSSNVKSIKDANIYVVTVPTPIDNSKNPDLGPLRLATEMISEFLCKGDLVIYESTVYPGCVEEFCVPILERISGLSYNIDFTCGYSPERINPGDKKYTLTNIVKVVSGSDQKTLEFMNILYSSIIKAGVYNASSIKTAEAAKVIENIQRDINIALINELAIIFDKLDIDTNEVLDAASTKWNFLRFTPGLVGGHCISVDPYYLKYKAEQLGYSPKIISSGRQVNDYMSQFIFEKTINEIDLLGLKMKDSKITILGLSFKENCPDIRNTMVLSIFDLLQSKGCNVQVSDDYVDRDEVKKTFNLDMIPIDQIKKQDIIIIAVSHDYILDIDYKQWLKMLVPNGLVIDIKSIFPLDKFEGKNIKHWRL